MRGDPILLVECDQCHYTLEVPLVKASWQSVWTGYEINGYLARHGWVSDPIEHGDYCSEACRKAATKGRRTEL